MFISLKTSDGISLIEPGYKARLKLRYKIKHMFNLILYSKNITEAVVTFDTSRTFTNEQRTMRVKVETYGNNIYASVVDRIIYDIDSDILAIHCDSL